MNDELRKYGEIAQTNVSQNGLWEKRVVCLTVER